ncbi:MAG: ferritin-like domain-containing protein [Actinobacteria bacterium]|nr:MAG: ferritin-like domain-containing protein [Actinomycetota bacterium]
MAILGENVETPRELYVHQLGAALKMENKILEMLPQLEEEAQDGQLQKDLKKHQQETRAHVRNLEQVFRALGEEPDEQACPTIEGLEKEGQSMLGKVDESLNDAVILSAVVETEAHEIAVYDGLITVAEAMDDQDIVALLRGLATDRGLGAGAEALRQAHRPALVGAARRIVTERVRPARPDPFLWTQGAMMPS